MTARTLLAVVYCLTVAVGAAAAQDDPRDPLDRPNVVLILSDDQAWTDYGFMGHEAIETQHLDRLARQSLTFTRGYVPESLCRPSLASIVTGMYPHQHGIVGNDPPLLPGKNAIESRRAYFGHMRRAPKLPAILQSAGYLCFQTGKWWEGDPKECGFTHAMTHGDIARGGRHGDEGLTIGRKGLKPIDDFLDVAKEERKPFFIWYAPMLPHSPHTPPDRLLAKYGDRTPHLPIAKYWAMCEWFDETVGELLGKLDERELAENTLVVYVTDNGWINKPDESAYAPRSKRSQYDGGLRTPIMLRWPANVAARMEMDRLASSIDLAPTILTACGLSPAPEMSGVNLLDDAAVAKREAVFGGIFEHDIQSQTEPAASLRYRWIVSGRHKLIAPNLKRLPDAQPELFDVIADPHEEHNLAAEQVKIVEALSKRIDGWWDGLDR